MDVLGRTLYDLIDNSAIEARGASKAAADKHNETVTMLEQRFEDMKADISAVVRSAERASDQNQAVNAKLDKLLDFVKEEVVERLSKQTKKNADLESNIRSLQSAVQELQKVVESKWQATSSQPHSNQNPFTSPLPSHRSQPSLGFDPSLDFGRNYVQRPMAPFSEVTNDSRLYYVPGENPNGAGQQWYRPSTAGRDAKGENNHFTSSNPYSQANGAQTRNGYPGYGGYYAGGPNEHGFGGYNQGGAK
jgi:archaellum component FlaC